MKMIVDNLAIEYLDQGEGPVMVLLHGWASQAQTFDELASNFIRDYRVLRPDLPGFGASEKPDDSWGIERYAELVEKWLAKLEVDQVEIMIGHSFGGRVAIKIASRGVLPIKSLVLLDSAGVKAQQNSRMLGFKAAAKAGRAATSLPGLRKIQDPLRRRLYKAAGTTDYLDAGPLRQIFLNTINEDLLPDAAMIQQPTLLLYGQNDTETPADDARKLAAQIRNSRLEILPDAGHFAYQDQLEQTVSLIRKFCS